MDLFGLHRAHNKTLKKLHISRGEEKALTHVVQPLDLCLGTHSAIDFISTSIQDLD